MNLYFAYNSNSLKKEIRSIHESIKRNNKNIKLIKEELKTGNHVYSYRAHKRFLKEYILLDIRLRSVLEETLRSVF